MITTAVQIAQILQFFSILKSIFTSRASRAWLPCRASWGGAGCICPSCLRSCRTSTLNRLPIQHYESTWYPSNVILRHECLTSSVGIPDSVSLCSKYKDLTSAQAVREAMHCRKPYFFVLHIRLIWQAQLSCITFCNGVEYLSMMLAKVCSNRWFVIGAMLGIMATLQSGLAS